jgi:archaellum biogenesis ATPase FlaH
MAVATYLRKGRKLNYMLGMVTTIDAVTTGVKDIAEAMGGGIHEGSLVLIEGEAKSGKSTLCQHIAHGVLFSRECSVGYYTMNSSTEDLMTQMESLSLYTRHELVTDRLRVYEMYVGDHTRNAEKSLRLLTEHISELPERFKLIVIDSVTLLMDRVSPMVKMDFLQTCKELCMRGRSVVLALDTHVFEKKILFRAYAMSDYYLRLRSQDMMLDSGQLDTRVIKTLQVTKLAGAERLGQETIKFEIKPRVGIQILPFVKIRV